MNNQQKDGTAPGSSSDNVESWQTSLAPSRRLKKRHNRAHSNGPSVRLYSQFQASRKSFVDYRTILQREEDRPDEEKLSSRRSSQQFSTEIDSRKIFDPKTRITLEWRGLNYGCYPKRSLIDRIRRKARPQLKELVIDTNGCIRPGTMVAFLGPSGAGKSIVLTLLSSFVESGEIRGEIRLNGIRRIAAHQHIIGYVQQDTNHLDSLLTVQESLEICAELTLPSKYSKDEKSKLIEKVMKSTGILRIASIRIGDANKTGISGGERKRLAVALELLLQPKILFLDEPTSGLDSSTALDLVTFLHQLAMIDHISVIMTIHQPRSSILSKFDELYLFAEGKAMFIGDMDNALEFFKNNGYPIPKNENPADFFVDIVTVRTETGTTEMEDLFRVEKLQSTWKIVENELYAPFGPAAQPPPQDPGFLRNVSRIDEIKALIRWNCLSYYRDKTFMKKTVIFVIFNSVLISIVYFQMPIDGTAAVQNRMGIFSILTFDRLSMMSTALLLSSRKRKIRQDRSRAKYRATSYYFVFWLISSILWIAPIAFFIPVYYIVHLRYVPFTSLLIFIGYEILYQWASVTTGILIGTLVTNEDIGLRIAIMAATVLRIFGGFAINTENISWVLRWIRYISTSYFFLSGVVQNEFLGQTINQEPGSYWIYLYGFGTTSMLWCMGSLIILTISIILIAFILFYYKTKPIFRI